MEGSVGSGIGLFANIQSGVFSLDTTTTDVYQVGTGNGYKTLKFRASNVVPTAYENRPASISFLVCVTY